MGTRSEATAFERRLERLEETVNAIVTDEQGLMEGLEGEVRRASRLALYAVYIVRTAAELNYIPKKLLKLARVRMLRDLVVVSKGGERSRAIREIYGDTVAEEKSGLDLSKLEREIAKLEEELGR